MTRRLYTLVLPSGAELTDEQRERANLSELGLLDGGGPGSAVERLSQQPGSLQLRGQIRDPDYAPLMAAELRELATNDAIGPIPLFTTDTETEGDGFYVVDQVRRIGPVEPQTPEIQDFRLAVSKKGTQKTHWVAVATNQEDISADNPFSSGSTILTIAYPAAAVTDTKQWYDPVAGVSAPAHDAESSSAGEFISVDAKGPFSGQGALQAQDAAKVLYRNGNLKVNWTTTGNGTKLLQPDNLFARANDGETAGWRTDNQQTVGDKKRFVVDINIADIQNGGEVEIGVAGGNSITKSPSSTPFRRWYYVDISSSGNADLFVSANTSSSGDVAEFQLYDASLVSEDRANPDPTLLYEIDKADIGKTDLTLWDTRGNADKEDTSYGGSGVSTIQWQRVFNPEHEFIGRAVVDNSFLRIYIDESAQTIEAEEWDDGTSSWASVSLGSSDWKPIDVDPIRLGTAEVELEVRFTDGDRHYPLRLILPRGFGKAKWLRPPEESRAAPSGLTTLLDPIATAATKEQQPRDVLVPRSEVRD